MKLRRMMVSFLMLAALVGICVPVTVRADCSHTYENGFCTACGGYEEAVLNGDVYEISYAGQLYWFSELVTSGQTAVNGKLTQDIVVNEDLLSKLIVQNDGTTTVRDDYTLREWLPIGSKDAKFEGTFDGNGKSISGLYFDHREATVALFRYIASGGTVKNVRILASCLTGGGTRGGIVDTNEGTVDNCSYAGYIGCSNSSSGGIVYSNRGTVVNCENEAIVRGQGYVGGIAGENLGKLENCRNIGETYGRSYVGGIAGLNGTNGEIISCLNTKWVTADSTTGSNNNVGGIVGSNSGTISKCGNSGQIALLYGNIGGIVGWNGGAVTDCYNTGEIDSGYDNAGGIIGYHGSGASAVNCCNTGAVRPMNCLYDWNGKYFGAIIGRNENGTVTNCHYPMNSAQDRYNRYQQGIGCGTMGDYTPDISGQTAGKTSTQLASGEVTWLLNGSTSEGDLVWHQDIGTDAAPLFEGGVVYKVQTGGCKSGNYTYGYANEQLEAVFSHIEVTDEAVEATCTADGLTEGKHCSACGEVLTAQETIPAPGHKDEVKDHNCDSCGEKLSDCAESVLHYYDHAIPVSAADAANLKNSSYIRVIGVEEVLRRVDNIAQIAVDASALDGIIESEDFRTYAAEVLGVDIGSLNDKAWELAENLANTSGISLEEAVTELSHNMATMYGAHSAVAMDKAEITAFLTDPGSREILSDNLRYEESQNLGFTQAVLVYGMYTAYAYTREDDSLIANLDSLSIVLNAFDDPAFLEYTAGEQGGIDLNGYLSALNMIRECAENDAAAMELLAAGFNDGELKEAVQTMLDELDHTCDICGKVLSECQWGDSVVTSEPTCTQDGVKTSVCTICGAADTETVPATGHTEVTDEAVEATCTETGLTEGSRCSVCGEVLVAQETIPAPGHKDEVKDHRCDSCGKVLGSCVETALVYNGMTLPVSTADAAAVNNSIFGTLDTDEMMNLAESLMNFLASMGSESLGVVYTNEEFQRYLAKCLGCEVDELMDMQKQFTDEEVNLILARAAILFAANNRDRVHPKAITNHLYNGNAISITLNWLHGTNGMTQNVNAAMAMATSTYGMLFAYANRLPEGAEKDEMMTIVANPLQAMTYVNDMDFRNYVRTEEGQQDLTGYLGIMGMLANSVRTPSVTKHILENGFANETLKAGFAAVLENVDHNCDICGKVMSECQWDAGAVTTQPSCTEDGIKTMICTICGAADTEPVPATGHTEVTDEAVEATCTETGLTEGSHCSVCKAVLVAQEVVPTVGHS